MIQAKHSVLFCWSGGGMPGLDIHAGIWKALEDARISATANAGTSAGAIMAAFNSAGHSQGAAEAIIRSLTDSDVRKERFAWKLRVPWIGHFLEHQPIAALLLKTLPDSFAHLEKPCSVFVTHEEHGSSQELISGALRHAVLASMSISGVFPPVRGATGWLSDGGTTAHLPLPMDWRTYDEVYLLVAKRPLNYNRRKGSMLTRLIYNMDLLWEDQVRDTIALAQSEHPCVKVIRPALTVSTGMLRFDHSLINQAYEAARDLIGQFSETD